MPKRTNDGISKRCDCARRKWPKCIHPWHFNFHFGGKEHRHSLDTIARREGVRPPATKAEAMAMRDRLRSAIRAGTFGGAELPADDLTFGDVVRRYENEYVNVPTRRASAAEMFNVHLQMLLRAEVPGANGARVQLRHKPIAAITRADVEAVRADRRKGFADVLAGRVAGRKAGIRRPGVKGGEVGLNRLLARLRHLFSWAIQQGYLTASPFKLNGVTVVKLESKAESARQRRLQPGEEDRLLANASPHMRALILAALSTGCRPGELRGLRWSDIRRDADGAPIALDLAAARTKTSRGRVIPVGSKLRAVLEMRQTGPDGAQLPAAAYVFGNEVGEPVKSIRAAWNATCAAAGIIDLHANDLRREFACRLLESSAGLHDVRDFLGHSNISTTSTYLASSPVRLENALGRMEGRAEPRREDPADSHIVRTNDASEPIEASNDDAVTH
ncbi:MAG: site-specific integrase [Acidobacteria bacterium]|nr:site-specific integrase [Acidobacteriota bacterium]